MFNEILNKAMPNQTVKAAQIEPATVVEESVETKTNVVNFEPEQKSPEKIQSTVSRLNSIVQSIERDLNFKVDEESGKTVITVLDTKTEEIIRQIPADHVLALSENIESFKGLLFSAEV